MEITLYEHIDKKLLEDNPITLYIIEDNLLNSGFLNIVNGGDYKNILSIKTRKNHNNKISSFFKDSELEIFKESIFKDFIEINSKFYTFNKICLKKDGYGKYLEKYSPILYNHISDLLKYNFGFDNKETISKRIPSYNDINKSKSINITGYQQIKNELIKNHKSIGITTNIELKMGDIIKMKRDDSDEQIIGIVNISSYNIDNIDINKYNLFEGYTKSNNGSLQFLFEYIGYVKNGSIVFADNNLNKIDNNIKNINKIDNNIKNINKIDKPLSNSFIEETQHNTLKVVKKKKVSNSFKILSSLVDYEITSVLELTNNDFLVLDTMYLYRIKDFDIINKIDMIDYKIVEVFDKVFLYIKENVLNQDRLIVMDMGCLSESDIMEFFN